MTRGRAFNILIQKISLYSIRMFSGFIIHYDVFGSHIVLVEKTSIILELICTSVWYSAVLACKFPYS